VAIILSESSQLCRLHSCE